jgi:DNA-binding XRE family transcriptional regulator
LGIVYNVHVSTGGIMPASKRSSAFVRASAVRAARESHGLTQAEAAAVIGFSVRAWQAWELGTRRMRAVLLDSFNSHASRSRAAPQRQRPLH